MDIKRMRIIGIDFGERRIGVAAAEDRTGIAIPVRTVEVKDDPVAALVAAVREERADEVVVGMPLSLTGAEGPQAQRVREVVEELRGRVTAPVTTYDERLTTAQARRVPETRRRGAGRRPQPPRDSVAAAIMLQAYLDSRRPHG